MTRLDGWDGIEGIVLDAVGTLIDPEPSVAQAYAIGRAPARAGRRSRRGQAAIRPPLPQRRGRRAARADGDRRVDRIPPMAADRRQRPARPARPGSGLRRALGPFRPTRSLAMLPRRRPRLGSPSARRAFPSGSPPTSTAASEAVAAGLPELAGFVETLVISSEVGYRKPHAAFYRRSLRQPRPPARSRPLRRRRPRERRPRRRAGRPPRGPARSRGSTARRARLVSQSGFPGRSPHQSDLTPKPGLTARRNGRAWKFR